MASTVLSFLAPVGIALVLWAGMPEARARGAAARLLAVLGLATLGYWATGFALQYGGIGCLHNLPGLGALDQQLPLWPIGPTWGVAGTTGWFLAVPSADVDGVLRLFLAQLPWLVALATVAGLSLVGRERGAGSLLVVLLLAALIGPLVAGWTWAGGPSAAQPFLCARPENAQLFDLNYGGWLGNLGLNAGWGHGFVDYSGAGTLYLLAGAVALAAMLTFGPRRAAGAPGEAVEMPPVHLPLLAVLGLVLWFCGWIAWPLAHPLYAGLSWPIVAVNGLLAVGAGTLVAQGYSAFTAGRADVLMAVRGGAAALVAISAGAPFVPDWGALLIGAFAGALVPVMQYLIEQVWGREDHTAAIAVFGTGGLWGLLALGLLASGRYGVGWNALGAQEFLGTPPQGVTGLIVAPGLVSDTRQMLAQLVGAGVIALMGFAPAYALFQAVALPARLVATQAAATARAEARAAARATARTAPPEAAVELDWGEPSPPATDEGQPAGGDEPHDTGSA